MSILFELCYKHKGIYLEDGVRVELDQMPMPSTKTIAAEFDFDADRFKVFYSFFEDQYGILIHHPHAKISKFRIYRVSFLEKYYQKMKSRIMGSPEKMINDRYFFEGDHDVLMKLETNYSLLKRFNEEEILVEYKSGSKSTLSLKPFRGIADLHQIEHHLTTLSLIKKSIFGQMVD